MTDVIVVDGNSGKSTVGTHVFLAGDDGHLGRSTDIVDDGHVGSSLVVSGDIESIAVLDSSSYDGLDIVGIRESEDVALYIGSLFFHSSYEIVGLYDGIGFS